MLRKTVSKIRESDFDVSDLMNPNEKLVFDKYVKDYEEEMKILLRKKNLSSRSQ